MAKGLKLCEMHSFSTSSNSRHHTTTLNADVPNCYTMLKVAICNELANDLTHNKLKCGLFIRIISSYNSSVQNWQNYAWSVTRVDGHKCLDDDATRKRKAALAA